MDVIGENLPFKLHLTMLPVRHPENEIGSVSCLLGRLARQPELIIAVAAKPV